MAVTLLRYIVYTDRMPFVIRPRLRVIDDFLTQRPEICHHIQEISIIIAYRSRYRNYHTLYDIKPVRGKIHLFYCDCK